jgi:UPF0176 protein
MQIPFETKPIIKDWDFVVLLLYKYVPIEDPEAFMAAHKALCERLNIKGRFIIAHEGINGTCECTPNQQMNIPRNLRAIHDFQIFISSTVKEQEKLFQNFVFGYDQKL